MKILNKIDLHLHIDGSARPETVYELSRKYQIEPECHKTLEEIRNSMIIPDGEYDPDFLTFEAPIRAMQNEEGLYRITKELVKHWMNRDWCMQNSVLHRSITHRKV